MLTTDEDDCIYGIHVNKQRDLFIVKEIFVFEYQDYEIKGI